MAGEILLENGKIENACIYFTDGTINIGTTSERPIFRFNGQDLETINERYTEHILTGEDEEDF